MRCMSSRIIYLLDGIKRLFFMTRFLGQCIARLSIQLSLPVAIAFQQGSGVFIVSCSMVPILMSCLVEEIPNSVPNPKSRLWLVKVGEVVGENIDRLWLVKTSKSRLWLVKVGEDIEIETASCNLLARSESHCQERVVTHQAMCVISVQVASDLH